MHSVPPKDGNIVFVFNSGSHASPCNLTNTLPEAEFPSLMKLNEAYEQLPAFRAAMSDMQPDAVKP
ncbi:Glutathione S-transferase zeta-1 [Asimina triloba]